MSGDYVKSKKVRIYPTPEQAEYLNAQFGECALRTTKLFTSKNMLTSDMSKFKSA